MIEMGQCVYFSINSRKVCYFFFVILSHVSDVVRCVCPPHAPPARYLFWSEWGQNPCIGRSRLDGSDQVTLVNSGITWPNGISIDYEVTVWSPSASHNLEVAISLISIKTTWLVYHLPSLEIHCLFRSPFPVHN